jgi:hypothetical protein
MNYADNLTYLANYTSDLGYATDPDWLAQLPIFIETGERRILRDLDMLSSYVNDTTASLTPFERAFLLPTTQGKFQAVATIQIRMSYTQDIAGTLFTQPALQWVSREWLNAVYPDDNAVGAPSVPRYVAPVTDNIYAVGPAPGVAYPLVIYGQIYPNGLSAANPETYISVNMPDLMLASEMISVQLWLKQFGQTADEPAAGTDWVAEYNRLRASADVLEARSSIQGRGWGIRGPNQLAESTPG